MNSEYGSLQTLALKVGVWGKGLFQALLQEIYFAYSGRMIPRYTRIVFAVVFNVVYNDIEKHCLSVRVLWTVKLPCHCHYVHARFLS